MCEDNKNVTEALKILDAQQADKIHPRSLETNHETISGGGGGGGDDDDDEEEEEDKEEEEEEYNRWKFTSNVIFAL